MYLLLCIFILIPLYMDVKGHRTAVRIYYAFWFVFISVSVCVAFGQAVTFLFYSPEHWRAVDAHFPVFWCDSYMRWVSHNHQAYAWWLLLPVIAIADIITIWWYLLVGKGASILGTAVSFYCMSIIADWAESWLAYQNHLDDMNRR